MEKAQLTFVAYRPRPGKLSDLEILVKKHYQLLKSLDLVTSHEPFIGRASDGSLIEVFEWKSQAACFSAHEKKEVSHLWESMGAVADIISMRDLNETAKPFPHFERFV